MTTHAAPERRLDSAEKYHHFDPAPDSSHNLVLGLVPAGARVLEFGCATGYMSAALRERLGCAVTGVEISEAAGEQARGHLDRLIVGDAETLDYDDVFRDERFDAILFADVLEHLRDPGEVLRKVRPLLAAGGAVVASIPNVAHGSVRLALLNGEFRYRDVGLLDDTHLRFFTRQTVQELFEQSGYVVERWCRRHIDVDDTELDLPIDRLAETIRGALAADPEVTTYQFVVRAMPVGAVRAASKEARASEGGPGTLRVLGERVECLETRSAHLEERQEAARRIEQELVSTQLRLEAAEQQREQLGAQLSERQELLAERRQLREILAAQASRLEALARQVEELADHDRQLSRKLAGLRDELLRRGDDVEGLLYELHAARSAHVGEPGAREARYQHGIHRIRETVRVLLPRDATVIVVSRGDDDLLRLFGRSGWHFPQIEGGVYAGYYPASDSPAIAHLEYLRGRGGEFLLIPDTARWWLERYPRFARHLDARYARVVDQAENCLIYDLREVVPTADQSAWAMFQGVVGELRECLGRDPAILDWGTDLNLRARFPEWTIFTPVSDEATLPYLDRSIDIVAIPSADGTTSDEARRVASGAVVAFERRSDAAPGIEVVWVTERRPVASASVSIVIPVYNALRYTEACLASLRETLPADLSVEVIVVDDGSTDDTPIRLAEVAAGDARLTVIRNETNLGFLGSSNRGAQATTGDILIFLNNDTVLLPGWLEPLLRTFREQRQTGAVGGKLLFPDGRLQEAGGIIFSDGSAAHFGRGEMDPDEPMFSHVREVDYCSGALLATPRDLFAQLGGFDTRYAPAYYEDTDYCFRLREQGYRIYYQPDSTIVHVEGATAGTDLNAGTKRYQVVNRAKFIDRWRDALRQQPPRPDHFDPATLYPLVARGDAGGDQTR